MKLKTIIFFTIALFIFPFISANQGFNAIMYSGGSEICSCTNLQDVISITNNDIYPQAYTISLSSKNNLHPFYTLSNDFFILNPLETIEIDGFFTPPCNFSGKDSIDIIIESNLGIKRIIKKDISVIVCDNNAFTHKIANSYINDPCTLTRYDLKVQNIGTYPEIYMFDVDGLSSDYITFSDNSIFLQPGESAEFFADIILPCEDYGVFKGNFISKAQNSGIISKIPFMLTIERNYNFSLSFGFYDENKIYYKDDLNYEYCADLTYKIPVNVQNNVFIANSYDIKIPNNNWIKSDKKQIGILGNENSIFNITFQPNKNNIGNYLIPVKLTSKRGSLSSEANLNISVIDCSSFEIEVDYNKNVCCGKNSYKFRLKNLGYIENNFIIESDINFSQTNITLNPRELIEFDIDLILLCDEDNNFNIKVSNFLETKEMELSFNTFSTQQCQQIILNEKTKSRELIFYDGKKIPIYVENIGIEYSNYITFLEGPEWVSIDKSNFTLGKNEIKMLELNAYPYYETEPGIYTIEIIHISDNGYRHVNIIDIELKEWNLSDAIYLFTTKNKGITILLILILIVLIMLIVFFLKNFKNKKSKKKEIITKNKKVKNNHFNKKNKEKKIIGWILLILLLIFLFYIGYVLYDRIIKTTEIEESELTPEEELYNYVIENNLTNSFFYHIWFENEIYLIDLDDYFEDPNDELLNYSSSKPENIEVIINGSLVTLIPKQDWTGIDKINFTITNKFNESLTSSQVNLIVRKKQETIDDEIDKIIIEEIVEETKPEEELYNYIIENNLTDSFLYHILIKDEVYTINLDNHFKDPDGEPLTYSSSFPENIDVIIDESIVYLTPKTNWTGVEKIYFKGTDTAGDFAVSPEITLIVIEKQEIDKEKKKLLDNIGFYTKLYLTYIVIGIIILIMILISLRKKK
jgi:hypothetical protein